MKNDDDILEIEAQLIEIGIPKQTAADLAPAWQHRIARYSGWWIMFGVMIAGFAVGALWIWPFFEGLAKSNAIQAANEASAWMYDTNFGIGMIVLLFAWILVSGIAPGLLTIATKMLINGALYLGALTDRSGGWWYGKLTRRAVEKLRPSPSPNQLVTEWAKAYCIGLLKWALPLVLISALILTKEINAHSLYGPDGYTRSPLLPWAKTATIPWNEATKVELGCNHTDDGGSLVYKISFSNGKSVRIEDGIPIKSSWIDAMESVDTALQRGGAEFVRWQWLNRDPMHPKCLRGYYGLYGEEDGSRIIRLLRFGEFPEDGVAN
jgi:hypothetical protein